MLDCSPLALQCSSSSMYFTNMHSVPTRITHFRQYTLLHIQCDDYSIRGPSALTMPLINKKKRKSALTNDSDSESERCHQSSAKRQRRNEVGSML